MATRIPRTGKQTRPKTAIKGKRYHCAKCRKRSPKPVKTPAPWYCANCLKEDAENKRLAMVATKMPKLQQPVFQKIVPVLNVVDPLGNRIRFNENLKTDSAN